MTPKFRKPANIRKLKVCAFIVNEGFCGLYRVRFPLEALQNDGMIELKCTTQGNTLEMFELCAWADVILFQYAVPSIILQKVQDLIIEEKLPKIVLCDFDDNHFETAHSNPNYKNTGTKDVWYEKKGKKTYIWKDKTALEGNPESIDFDIERNKKGLGDMAEGIICSDAVIVSTDRLKHALSKFNDNIHVLKNCIQPIEMPGFNNFKKRGHKDEIVIGWHGGSSHFDDLKRVIPAFEEIQRIYKKKVKFRFFGASSFEMMFKNLNYEIIPWIKPNLFFDRFSQNLFDIGIIPLENNIFNKAKSNIKWLEMSFYGIPVISANITPYKDDMIHRETGLLYDSVKDLTSKMVELIEDPILRMSLATNAHNHVNSTYNVNLESIKWYNFFSDVLENKLLSYKIN